MLPVVRGALSRLSFRSIQHTAKRPKLKKQLDFHDNYGSLILVGGALFFAVTYTYALTHYDLQHYLSPVGRVEPKAWKKL